MSQRGVLSHPPVIEVDLLADHAPARTEASFLWVRHVTLQNRYADGHRSKAYEYFMVERTLLDAVAIVLFRRDDAGGVEVVLRSQLRPPLAFRHTYDVPLLAPGTGAVQWEIPAGLIELGERGEAGLFRRASAEVLEEVGFVLPPERFSMLGPASSLSPGLLAEKLHFVCAELRAGDQRVSAAGDGHAVEEGSVSVFVPLAEAVAAVDAGLVHDVKTEVGLARLARLVGAP
ncbi:MAG: NUDIX hydrolase [Myxococcales bacterium]